MGDTKTRTIALAALLFAVIGVSVAFAAMSQTLTINGTATVSPAFSVKFANLSGPNLTGGAQVIDAPTLTSTHIGNYKVKLTKKDDKVVYTFDIKNTGTINATLATFTKPSPVCSGTGDASVTDGETVCNNLEYKLAYTNGGTLVQESDTLNASETKNVTLTIGYKSDSLPINNVEISNLDITLVYNGQ